jgi:Fe-S oxidoreductase
VAATARVRTAEVLHTSEVLDRMLSSGTIEMGVYDAPRQVTEAATGQPSAELLHSRALAECCGAGLAMFLPEPVLAEQVANVRLPWSLAYQRWRVSV